VTVVFTAVDIGVTIPCGAVRPARHSPPKRLEAWLWTGPLGHFVAGVIDWLIALARYAVERATRGRRRRRA
jgi:hypothetical protein